LFQTLILDEKSIEVELKKSTFCCGNYSREDTIQGRKLFKGGNYSRAETRYMRKYFT
jgi:hypothetical protein